MYDGYTKVNALLANPCKHSLSPFIHNTLYSNNDLNYVYVAYEIEDISIAMNGVRELKMNGLNISMPFKTSIIPFLDRLDSTAKLCNAVNTVVLENDQYVGYNTDGMGLWNSLRSEEIDLLNHAICILGSGGSARAIISYMALQGVSTITVLKRNIKENLFLEFVDQIQKQTNCTILIKDSNDKVLLKETMLNSSLIIQATNVGMDNNECIVEDLTYFNKECIVVDLIYKSLETTFLKFAKEKGCRCFNGVGMLLHQAIASHILFTKQDSITTKHHLDLLTTKLKDRGLL